MRTSQGLPLTMLILGGWLTHNLERIHKDIARITSDNVDPGGWLTHNLERIHKDIARITSDNVDPGGWLTHNLERIHEDIARITSDNVDPGGSIDTQFGKNLCGHCKDYLWQCLSWVGSINTQLGKDLWGHCKDYLWQCWSGRWIKTQLGKDPQGHCKDYSDNVDPGGGGQLTHNLEKIHEDIARITSDNVDPGGWLTHNLERIHEDIARITSDNVDPGGWLTHNLEGINEDIARITSDNVDPGGVNQHTTWKGSVRTWQGLPLTMFIVGGGQSTHNLERIREDITRITSDNVDLGLNQHTTWKGSMRTLQGLPLTVLIWGCVSINTQLGRDPWGHCKDYLW